MKRRMTFAGVTVVMVLALAGVGAVRVAAQVPACATTTGPGGYSATVCLTAPAPDAVLTGTTAVTADVSTTGMPSGTRLTSVVFCENAVPCPSHQPGYVLTDFTGTPTADGDLEYSFNFDTTLYADTDKMTLYAFAQVNDSTTTTAAALQVGIDNGQNAPAPIPTGFSARTAASTDGLVVGAVGDGAGGEPGETDVANLISGWKPDLFLYLGDVYDKGSPAEFSNWYADYGYGALKSITDPTIGNHEYSVSDTAEGYFRYWHSPPHYYSFDAGGWRFISLDSTGQFDSSVSGVKQDLPSSVQGVTTQYDWLAANLAAHPGACTIVYFHHPVWNQGAEPRSTRMQAIWSLLAAQHVSLVLNGHDHDYQRYAAVDGNGKPDPTGVTEIVAGGGGHSTQIVTPGSQDGPNPLTYASSLAAVKLTLHSDRADFTAIAPSNQAAGRTIDQGSVPCQGLPQDTMPPSAPVASASVTMVNNLPRVDVAWQPATDNRAVAYYQIFRDGRAVSSLLPAAATTSWRDTSVSTQKSYSYVVEARDGWGNTTDSAPVSVTTPSATGTPTPATLMADTYVASASPSPKGTATRIRVLSSSSSTDVAYLKFDLRPFGADIARATLTVTPASSTSSIATAWPVADSSWDEATLGWPGPALGSTPGGSTSRITSGVPVNIDVTGLVQPGAVNTIALTETSGSTTQSFYSKEGDATLAPMLMITPDTAPDTSAPSVPTGVTANPDSENQVTLDWSASTDNVAVDHYVIYRDGTSIDTVPASTTEYVDSTVSAGTTYRYTVSAIDGSGNDSAQSAAATVSTPDLTAPEFDDAPAALATSAYSATVYWPPANDNVAVAGYRVYRDGTRVADLAASALRWQDDQVEPGHTYVYSVSAYDAAGNASSPSDAVAPSITTPPASSDTTAPSTPGAPTLTPSGSSVELSWPAATDDVGVAGYTVFEDGLPIAAVTGTSYLAAVSPSEVHTWRVDAVDAAGNHSPWGPSATAAYADTGPAPVADAAYVQSGSSADNNYQWASTLRLSGGSTQKVIYLMFVIDSTNALANVDHVYLTLSTSQTSNAGFDVHRVSDTSWTRRTITWNTQPGYGAAIASSGPVTTAGTVPSPPAVIDLAGIVNGPGRYSVALTSSTSGGQTYNSDVDSVPAEQRPSIEVISHS